MNRILITIVLAVLLLSVTACHNGKLTSSSNNEPDSLSIAAENQVEMPALARFEPDPNIQSDWKGIFLSFIGACQKKLNQPEEAKKNFEQAYQYYRKYMGEERFKLLDFQTCIVDLYNISMYYTSKETLKEEQMWNDRCDSLLSWYRIQPGADSAHVEMMDGVIALRRAHILLDEGKKAEADRAFEEFLKTKYSKGNEGRLIACGYLTKVGRYAEAANIYQDYDRIAGHNPPVVGGGDNQGDFLKMESNAPIGLWEGLEYEGEEIDTIKGRPLFIYTDGLNEAENHQQQQFGDDHLLDLLRRTQFASAQQVVESMVEAVSQHRDGAESNDDLTMMCICMD